MRTNWTKLRNKLKWQKRWLTRYTCTQQNTGMQQHFFFFLFIQQKYAATADPLVISLHKKKKKKKKKKKITRIFAVKWKGFCLIEKSEQMYIPPPCTITLCSKWIRVNTNLKKQNFWTSYANRLLRYQIINAAMRTRCQHICWWYTHIYRQ